MTTYHVIPGGGGDAMTILGGIALLSAGDTLLVHAGTYNERLQNWVTAIASGSSWSNPVIVKANPGDTVLMMPSAPSSSAVLDFSPGIPNEYIIFDGINVDGTNVTSGNSAVTPGGTRIRFQNLEIRNTGDSLTSGSGVSLYGSFNEFINCTIHDNGEGNDGLYNNAGGYGLYIGGTDNLVERCHIYHNGGYGVHIYHTGGVGAHRNIVRFNVIFDNSTIAAQETSDILLSSGDGNQAYGNLLYRTTIKIGTRGINVTGTNSKVYNNTVYGYGYEGISTNGSTNTIVQNNICFGNNTTGITANADFSNSPGLIEDHNLFTDPFFLNAGSQDFRLQAGSPAIDAGIVLPGITYIGSPDIGALEFGAEDLPVIIVDPIPPQPPEGGGTIDYDTDGDSVDIPGVGEGLPPSGSVPLPLGQTLVTVIAYNVNGSSFVTFQVRNFASGLTYRSAAGYSPRSIKGGADLSVDNSELVGIMANKAIANQLGFLIKGVLTDEDIEVGRFDNARDELFLVNYESLADGKYFLPSSGSIGQIKSKRGTFEAETRGKQYFLQQTFGDLISKLCRARVGDDVGDGTGEHDYKKQRFGCKVRIDPPFWRKVTSYTVRPENDAALGSVVKPEIYNGRHFECVVAGRSGSYPDQQGGPVWNLAVGSTTTDGSVTWRAILALEVFGSVTGTINRRFFQDSGRYEPPTTGIGINTQIAFYGIVTVSLSGNYFEIEGGDLTRVFLPGTTFAVTESIANDGTYTVTVSTLVDGRTRIVVSETIPDERAGGTIAAPNALASGFFTNGTLTFLTGLNRGITQEIKEFTLGQYPLVDVDQGAFKFMLDGDVTVAFVDGQRFAVAGSTGNDTEYNVVAVTYNIGTDQTEITVGSAIADATVDGNILAGPGQFELFERMPFDIELGDEYIASAGCDLSKAMCKFKFRNIYNRRAEDETPGTDVALLTPDRPQ